MKNLIIKLSLIAALVVACNTAMALTDGAGVQVLMHCDATNQIPSWLTTPDDNSSGRTANECILDMAKSYSGIDLTTQPTMMPNSPISGNYFSFDGNDSINLEPGWAGGAAIVCDFSFRYSGSPGQYGALISAFPVITCFLTTDGGFPRIAVMVAQNSIHYSSVNLAVDTWYNVRCSINLNNPNEVSITVDGTTDTEIGYPFQNTPARIVLGYDYRGAPIAGQEFTGDMDEIRIGTIPEPFTFGLIGLLGLLVIRRK